MGQELGGNAPALPLQRTTVHDILPPLTPLLLLLVELKISINSQQELAQRGWNQSCYVAVGPKSIAFGAESTLRPSTQILNQVYFLPVLLLPGQMIIMAHPRPWGPRHLVPAGPFGFWYHSILIFLRLLSQVSRW